jgi:hypothetical protein
LSTLMAGHAIPKIPSNLAAMKLMPNLVLNYLQAW